jgi:hypothetical protein
VSTMSRMKELQDRKTTIDNDNTNSRQTRRVKQTYQIIPVRAKAPSSSAPELPILSILAEGHRDGMQTKKVIQEVIAKWFMDLDEQDLKARYPASKRKITESVVKFARKNLVMKGELSPAGVGNPLGIWKLTPLGIEKALEGNGAWRPRYSHHDAILLVKGRR